MKILVCFLLYLSVVFASQCPELSTSQDFEVENFTGTWYQQSGINSLLWNSLGACAKVDIDLDEDSGTWYQQSGINSLLWNSLGACSKVDIDLDEDYGILSVDYSQRTSYGGYQSTEGFAVLPDSSSEGTFDLTISTIFGDRTSRLSVLSTDYDNYAVVYTCREVMSEAYETAWLFTRLQILDQDTNDLIDAAMEEIEENGGPAHERFTPVVQEDCF